MFVTFKRERGAIRDQDCVTIHPDWADGSIGDETAWIPSCVPDAVLEKVLAFSAATIKSHYPNVNADLVARCLADCYGPYGQHPAGNLLRATRMLPSRRLRTTRERIAEAIGSVVDEATPDWVFAWAAARVDERVLTAAGGVDIFGGVLRIDVQHIWELVANEVEARLAAVGMTPAVVDDVELGTPATA